MPKIKKAYPVLIGVLLVFAIFSLVISTFHKKMSGNVNLGQIPYNIGSWRGMAIPAEEQASAILDTDSVLMREYRKGTDKIWLAIVFYKDSRVAMHLPESCYAGVGSQIVDEGVETIDADLVVNKIILKGSKRNQIVLYYFDACGYKTPHYQFFRWHMILNQLKHKPNSGALIRFSTNYNGKGVRTNLEKLKGFIKEINPILEKIFI
ncbi:MAG: EpsI family protein [bacterium]|nr:EpsI family protein [bacterium]